MIARGVSVDWAVARPLLRYGGTLDWKLNDDGLWNNRRQVYRDSVVPDLV